jgi:hypothetical protein
VKPDRSPSRLWTAQLVLVGVVLAASVACSGGGVPAPVVPPTSAAPPNAPSAGPPGGAAPESTVASRPPAQVVPAAGLPGTTFRFGYGCAGPSPPVLTVATSAGTPAAPAAPIGPPTTLGPGRYTQSLQSEGDGSFVATVRCGTATAIRIPFTVVAAEYVGLGDSYSSGEGASAYLPATNSCDRAATTSAWEPAVARATRLSFDFAACSGAFLGDFVNPSGAAAGEIPQLAHVSTMGRTSLVTLTIGGNDAGFFPVVTSCITGPFAPGRAGCAQRDGAATEQTLRSLTSPGSVDCGPLPPSGPACQARPSLHGLYEMIAARLGHGGTLVVVGYPRLFGSVSGSCVVGRIAGLSYTISAADVSWLNAVAGQLDQLIAGEVQVAAVELARTRPDVTVRFVSVDAAFAGHRVCDVGTPWLRGLQFSGVIPSRSSFHPTDAGQQQIAGVVVAAVEHRG